MSEIQVQREMPRYQCHKKVWALKIERIDGDIITPADQGYGAFQAPAGYIEKHHPQPGGYYIVHDDGYKSYSPADAFESGYTRL